MENIRKLVSWILVGLLSVVIHQCESGSVVLRSPALGTEDLRSIDGYVAEGLPLFQSTNGFLLHSGMGPVIVKVKDPNKPIRDGIEQPNAGYYSNLPSVIPEGYEGVASTLFQLGRPIGPGQPSGPAPTTPQFPSPGTSYSTQSFTPFRPVTYGSLASPQAAQSAQQPQYASPITYNSAPYPTPAAPVSLSTQFQAPRPQFQPLQQPQSQSFFRSSFPSQPLFQQQPQQQQFQQQQQPQVRSLQQQQPQSQQLLERPGFIRIISTNSLSPEDPYDRSLVPTNFVGGTGIRSYDEIVRNAVLEETFGYEESQLPSNLKNPFYSNSQLAQALARESLPAQGEQVVKNWTTNKIKDGRIRDLLSGAGLLN